jgi:hypothetical protein
LLGRIIPRALLVTGAAVAAIALSGTAAWASVTIPLNPGQVGKTDASFKGSSADCGSLTGDQVPSAGETTWVFVLPHNDADFVSLTIKFSGGTVTIPDSSDQFPDGIFSHGQGTSQAFVVVPSGWTILAGSAAVVTTPTDSTFFNVTHTCINTASPSPSPSPSMSSSQSPSPSPSASRSESPSPSSSQSGSTEGTPSASGTPVPSTSSPVGGGGLPLTGPAIGGMLFAGAGAITAGILLLWLRRQRDNVTFSAEEAAADE